MKTRTNRATGFTLVELMVTVTIIAILTTVGVTLGGVVKRKAMMARESIAAKGLMSAFFMYSADNGGEILPGYKSESGVRNEEGEELYAPVNARYPWRLYPYIENVKGTLVFNGNEAVFDQPNGDYLVSVSPNLGMNTTFVGGHFGSGSLLRPSSRIEAKVGQFCIRRTANIAHATDIIVFLSARSDPEEAWEGRGYFEVQPPRVLRTIWSDADWTADAEPSEHGFVDLRWNGKAVAAMLDGSARVMDEEQLRDMRHWSVGAAEENDPEYSLSPDRG